MKPVSKIGLVVFYLAFSALFAYSAGMVPENTSFTALILPVAFFSLATAFLSVVAIAPVDAYLAIPALSLSSMAFPIFLGFSLGPAVLMLSYFLGALLFFFEVKKDCAERVKLSVGKSVEAGLSILFTFFFIGVAVFSYIQISGSGKAPADFIPDKLYTIAMSATAQAMASELNCTLEMTVDSCVDKIASAEIARNVAQSESQCSIMSPEERAACVAQVESILNGQIPGYKQQLKQSLLEKLDKTAKGTDRLSDLLSKSETLKSSLKDKLSGVFAPVARYLPILAALIVFSSLNILSFPIGALAKLLAWIFISGLVAAKIVKKQAVEVEAEILE
ncbi:MAG: hypothetical protein V1820_05475 [archaeon]